MPTYDLLQPLTFHVKAFDGHPLAQYRAYTFPASWARDLRREVFRARDDEPDEPRGIPLWAANSAVAALMPQVLTHDATGRADTTWLAWGTREGTPPPDEELLVEFVRGGLIAAAQARNAKAARRGRPPVIDLDTLAGVVAGFDRSDLHPSDRELQVGPGRVLGNEGYALLPHVLATHLVSTGWQVEHGGWDSDKNQQILYGISTWRRTAYRPGAELVSWPPHVYVSSNGTRYPWSYTLRFTAQTLPLDPDPRIHVHVGIRRWARTGVFDGHRAIGVHLFAPSPWSDNTCPFGLAAMKWQPGPYGKREGRMVWNDGLAPTLERLTSASFLPSLPELARSPLAFLEPAEGKPPLAGVPFRHGLGEHCKHSVGDGVSARDRWRIFTQLQPALADFTTVSKPYRRTLVVTRERPKAAELLRIDRAQLTAAVGPKVELALWYDTTVMRRELMAAAAHALGFTWDADALNPTDPTQPIEHHEDGPPLDLTVRVLPTGDLGAELNVDTTIRSSKDRVAKAAAERHGHVTRRMNAPEFGDASRFAVLEMAGAASFNSPEHDPKLAVKAGASTAGVLIQNITPPKPLGVGEGKESASTRTERARRSVGDLLVRQTGLLTPPDVLGTSDVPLGDVTSVGLWVIRRNGEDRAVLPLAVAWLPDQPCATIRLPHVGSWMPSRQALLALGGWNTDRVFTNEQVQEFFGEVVQEISDGSDTALFTLAQNIRSCCPGIANSSLKADVLAFNREQPIPVERRKGLRHLRLRTNLRSETSQHYAHKDTSDPQLVGLGSDLWADPDHPRRFFSTPDKPVSAGPGSPRGSRLEPHWGKINREEYGWKVDTLKDVWNPCLLEILVAVKQETDLPAAWAAFAHQQRYAASHFADPLALPIVLHLANKVAEYVLPTHQIEPIQLPDT